MEGGAHGDIAMQDMKAQPRRRRQRKLPKFKCLLPIQNCDCECDCRNCLCLSECTKFSYPWSTFLGFVVMGLYLAAWLSPWLIGPQLADVPCYSIGIYGELCDQGDYSNINTSDVCCPNIICCPGSEGNQTDASIILVLTIPAWTLSVISFFFTVWSWSSRHNISCWCCCCCCENNACNVDCCQISETTVNCCDTIQLLTVLIRLATILLTIAILYMFETNDSIKQLKKYASESPSTGGHLHQPGMIMASIALCFDFITGLLLSVDFWARKKSNL